MTLAYRPDIDGLRAIAVSLVVFYHAYPSLIKRGYIGVDMFFVISGFLITCIILKQGISFSLIDFYARRFKRILPAFITVIIATLALGFIFLKPNELANLFKHTAASLLFIENFLLFFEVDYFDKAAEYKPLLHIWSLAVEEQFYLIWPLFLIFFMKKPKLLPWIIGLLIVLSLGLTIWLLNNQFFEKGQAFAFYFLPSRFWEFGLGGLAAWFMLKPSEKLLKIQAHFTSEIIVIFAAILLYLGATGVIIDRLQMIYGVFPLLLILIFGEKTWFNRTILASKPLVFLGLISYPFYLWHWSLFAIIQLYEAWLLVFVAFLLSIITYFYIEKPLRYAHISAVNVFLGSLIFLSIAAFSTYLYSGKNEKIHELSDVYSVIKSKFSVNCPYKTPSIICAANFKNMQNHALFWGDSHSGHFFGGLAEKDVPVALSMTSACRPLLPADPLKIMGASRCLKVNELALQTIQSTPSIKTVFMGLYQTNAYYLHAKEYFSKEAFFQAYLADHQKTLNALFAAGKRVVILKDVPVLDVDPYQCEKRVLFSNLPHCSLTRARAEEKSADYNALLEKLKIDFPHLIVYDPTHLFCSVESCFAFKNSVLLYRDKNHLSLAGSRLIANDLEKYLEMNK